MTEAGGVQKNTAYGVFVQACWAQHKRQYPDELIHKEIEEFNKQCSVWWYNLSEQERDRFQEMADRSNAQQAAINSAYTVQSQPTNNIVTTVQTNSAAQQQQVVTNAAASAGSSQVGIPSFGSSFSYSDYGIQGNQQGQVVNAVVDNSGQVLNYSTNAGGQTVMRQVTQVQQQQQQVGQVQQQAKVVAGMPGQQTKVNQKPIKDPNAPKKAFECVFLILTGGKVKSEGREPRLLNNGGGQRTRQTVGNVEPNLETIV